MSRREEYEQRTEKLVLPIIEENKFELVDVEYVKEAGNWYLRVYVDKEGGIAVDDCEVVSRALSDKLDVTKNNAPYLEDPYGIKSDGLKNKDSYAFFAIFLTYDISPKYRECNN